VFLLPPRQTFLLGFPSLTLLKKRYAGAAAKAA
jgi:hypothetical protein